MSDVDDTVRSDKECGAGKRKKPKVSEAEIEFCKKTAMHYSLSSDGEFGRVESDSDGEDFFEEDSKDYPTRLDGQTEAECEQAHLVARKVAHKVNRQATGPRNFFTIGDILACNHANLSSVVLYLMNNRNTEVMAQAAFLKGDYLNTGKHDHCEDLEMLRLSNMTYYAGHVEQAIVAGLQIVYFFAKSRRLNGMHTAKDARVTFSHNRAKKFTRFDVFYKINGYDTKLAIAQQGDDSYISLYIED